MGNYDLLLSGFLKRFKEVLTREELEELVRMPHKECHNENLPLMFELMIDTSKELVDFMYSLPQRQRCYEKDFLLPLSRRQSLHLATG